MSAKKQSSDISLNKTEKKYLNTASMKTLQVKQRTEISPGEKKLCTGVKRKLDQFICNNELLGILGNFF
jgi:hypothetical protein